MHFEALLDALFGPREILHEMECSVCGLDETYYKDPFTHRSLGRACPSCNFVQKFEMES
ncbi:acyltransferase [Cytobacillus firmus]|uniref:acyltransferase n=1 Tax=Cytobacillus firmus TaxID=1399 RepID=UPI00367F0537